MSGIYTVSFFFFQCAAPSSAPFNLTLDELGSTYALLRWLPPPEGDHNGRIQHYQVYLNTSAETGLNVSTAGSESYILLDFLEPSTVYTCTVAAVTVSPGPTSDPKEFTTNMTGMKFIRLY